VTSLEQTAASGFFDSTNSEEEAISSNVIQQEVPVPCDNPKTPHDSEFHGMIGKKRRLKFFRPNLGLYQRSVFKIVLFLMITIKELARLAGTSTAAVSYVIHGKTNKVSPERCQQIRKLMEKYHYVEKMGLRHLNKGRSQIICLAVNRQNMDENNPFFADPFYGLVLGVVEEALHERDYFLMVYASEDIKEIFKTVAAWNIDGIIAVSFHSGDCNKLVELTGKPLVSIDTIGKLPGRFIHIGSEDAKGAYLMTKHLISRRCRNISIFANNDFGVDHDRFMGYKKALRESGIKPSEKLFVVDKGRSERQRQYEEYLAVPPPGPAGKQAAFFLSDFYAIEFISFLARKGIAVPDQIAVAGFDDIVYAALCNPGLTTVRQDIQNKALIAVECLFQALEGREQSSPEIRLPVELVIRDSA
jgi:LacI family transcriptional regulator